MMLYYILALCNPMELHTDDSGIRSIPSILGINKATYVLNINT